MLPPLLQRVGVILARLRKVIPTEVCCRIDGQLPQLAGCLWEILVISPEKAASPLRGGHIKHVASQRIVWLSARPYLLVRFGAAHGECPVRLLLNDQVASGVAYPTGSIRSKLMVAPTLIQPRWPTGMDATWPVPKQRSRRMPKVGSQYLSVLSFRFPPPGHAQWGVFDAASAALGRDASASQRLARRAKLYSGKRLSLKLEA